MFIEVSTLAVLNLHQVLPKRSTSDVQASKLLEAVKAVKVPSGFIAVLAQSLRSSKAGSALDQLDQYSPIRPYYEWHAVVESKSSTASTSLGGTHSEVGHSYIKASLPIYFRWSAGNPVSHLVLATA